MNNIEICYSNQTPEGYHYRVVLWTNPNILNSGYWYVHNTKTDTFRKIGKVKLRGSNNFDKAVKFCQDKENE